MNDQPSAPMLPPPSGLSAWFSTWREAVTKPNEQTFARIALSPQAKLTTAFLWIFLGSLVNVFLASLVQGRLVRQMLQNSNFGVDQFGAGPGGGLITAICGAPIGAIFSVVVFAIFVGIVQFAARMFGGRGTFEQLAYTMAAIMTPFYLISGLLTLLSAIPYAGVCFGIIGFLAAIYVLVLQVMAVKGVNQFSWGGAIGSFFLPLLLIICLCACLIFGLVSIFGQTFQDIFNQINQSLVP